MLFLLVQQFHDYTQVQSQQQKHEKNVNYIVPVFLLLDLTYLTHSSGVTIVGFEQVNVSWVMLQSNLHIIVQN